MVRKSWVVTVVACCALVGTGPAAAASDTTTAGTTTTTLTPSIGTPTSLVNTSLVATTQATVLGTQVSNDPLAHTGKGTGPELLTALALATSGAALVGVSRRARRLERRGAG